MVDKLLGSSNPDDVVTTSGWGKPTMQDSLFDTSGETLQVCNPALFESELRKAAYESDFCPNDRWIKNVTKYLMRRFNILL
jgi:hypothetical protein